MTRTLLFLFAACAIVASSAWVSMAAPPLPGSSPDQWNTFTQSAIQGGDFAAFRDALQQRIHAELPASSIPYLDQPVPALAVAQWRFLHEMLTDDPNALAELSRGANGKEFLLWLLTNREALDEYLGLTGIIPVKPPRSPGIDGWRKIWIAHPEARVPGLWTRVAAACAVVFAAPINGVTADQRFDFYFESHRTGQLIPYFDRETPFDLALAVGAHGRRNDELEWAQDVVPKDKRDQVSVSSYGFSLIAYRGDDYRGVSVQMSDYYDYRSQTLPLYMEYGGVCGAVSTINVDVANAFGVPAFTAGQPGHCAYVWKRDDKTWSGGNFVSGWSETASPHTQGFWLGDKAASVNLVSEAMDAPGFSRGERLRWLASAWRESDPAAAQYILAEATKANPLDYGAWQDRVDAALAWKAAPSQTWPVIAAGIVAAFPKFPMALNDLLGRFEVEKLYPMYSNRDRIAYATITAQALTGMPPAAQWDMIYAVWKPWFARQITGFGLPEKTAQALAEGYLSPANQLPAAESIQLQDLFAAVLPVVKTNPVMARGVIAAWVAVAAQDHSANARMAAYFQQRLANARKVSELAILSEAALASVRSSPDARADLAAAIRKRLESMSDHDANEIDALLGLLSCSNFHNADIIGTWDGTKLASGGDKTLEWDITNMVAKADDESALHVNFRWTGGVPLALKDVRLFENGQEVSADTRVQNADALLKPDASNLHLPPPKSGARYVVRAMATGSADSTGMVFCRAEPMATFDPGGWSQIGGWSLKQIKSAPEITTGWHDVEFNTGKFAEHSGPVFIHFQYGSYGCPRVMNVRLLVNGREVADDLHSCSPRDSANATYMLLMPTAGRGAKITVRALFNEVDGYGTVFVRKQNPPNTSAYIRAGDSL